MENKELDSALRVSILSTEEGFIQFDLSGTLLSCSSCRSERKAEIQNNFLPLTEEKENEIENLNQSLQNLLEMLEEQIPPVLISDFTEIKTDCPIIVGNCILNNKKFRNRQSNK